MITAQVDVAVPLEVLELQHDRLVQSPTLLNTAFDRAIRSLRQQFVEEAGTPKGAHIRPTDFQTDRQRRWWFKVGVHTWSGRTGALEKSWKTDLKVTAIGGVFRAYSTSPAEPFVQGAQVQRMHQSVWAQESDLFPKYAALAQTVLTETWRTVSDPTAGVPR